MLFFIPLMQEDILLDAQKFGSFLAALRKEHGMTQAELASKLQVTDKAVSRWERGVGLPDIATLTPLANALHITVSELLQAEKKQGRAASSTRGCNRQHRPDSPEHRTTTEPQKAPVRDRGGDRLYLIAFCAGTFPGVSSLPRTKVLLFLSPAMPAFCL